MIIPNTTAANAAFVAQTIRDAEAIFFAGGDQADYVNFWTNTAVESALYDALARNVPIGGARKAVTRIGSGKVAACELPS